VRLIERLGSPQFAEREQATSQLLDLDTVPPPLRAAMKAQDPEVRRRVVRIVRTIEKGNARRALHEVVGLAKDGAMDQAVERVVRWVEEDPRAEGQQALNLLVTRLAEVKTRLLKGPHLNGTLAVSKAVLVMEPLHPLEGYFDKRGAPHPLTYNNTKPNAYFFLQGAGIKVQGPGRGVITSTGEVTIGGAQLREFSLILSCGPVALDGEGDSLIIVCDGDVRIHGRSLNNSLIVARGNVDLPASVKYSLVVAGVTVKRNGGGAVNALFSLILAVRVS
jgi:adhesin HecA-like repeat protein